MGNGSTSDAHTGVIPASIPPRGKPPEPSKRLPRVRLLIGCLQFCEAVCLTATKDADILSCACLLDVPLYDDIGILFIQFDGIADTVGLFAGDQGGTAAAECVQDETHMICGDITDEKIRTDIVNESINKGINFIIATPPCQGMSVAGNRDETDPRNQLIYYAIDVIKRVKPDFVMLENVPQQLKTKIKINGELIKIPDYIRSELENDYDESGSASANIDATELSIFGAGLEESFSEYLTEDNGKYDMLDVFDYCYGILSSNTYRLKYAELLSIDFPRIPAPVNTPFFRQVARLGAYLRKLHLLTEPIPNNLNIEFLGTGDRIISGVHFSDNKVYINRTQYFSNVREDLWNFCFAGYHGLQKWFKDRRQSTISDAEIQHVITVFNVFDQSENHMEQLDEVLAEYEII